MMENFTQRYLRYAVHFREQWLKDIPGTVAMIVFLFLTNLVYPSFGQSHVSSIAHNTGGALLNAPHSVYVSGNYAYIVSYESDALEIVDISNPAVPVHRGSLTHGTGGSLLDGPMSVFVSGTYAFVASSKSDALEIVDISNPSAPTHTGSLKHGIGGALLDAPASIYVSGNHAYIVSAASNALEIVDISNPSAPVHKGSLVNGTGGALLKDPKSIYVSGTYAYVACYGDDALEILDVSNPASPVHKGSLTHGNGGAWLLDPSSVFVSGSLAYVTSWLGNALEIIDVSNPVSPVHKGSLRRGTGGSLTSPSSVFVSGNYAYVTSYSSDALDIIDISNPAAPVHEGSLVHGAGGALLDGAASVFVSGDYAYVASYDNDALEIVRVVKQEQTIDFDALSARTYGAHFELAATASSSLAVTYQSSNTSVATISGSTVTIAGVGSTIITASQAGNPDYYSATSISQSLTVNKAALTAKADDKSRPYGIDNPNFTISYSGFVNGDDAGDITVPTASATATSSSNAGVYTIVTAGGSADNYTLTCSDGTLTITKADQAIAFDALGPKTLGGPDFTLTATSSSGLDVSYSSSNPGIAKVNGNTVTIVGGGIAEITATQTGNGNYNAAPPVVQSLVVKFNQTITFNALSDRRLSDETVVLKATASSGLPVAYASSHPDIASINDDKVVFHKLGTVTIVASQEGNDAYEPAPQVQQTLTILKNLQSIAFAELPAKMQGEAPFALSATASSSLPVVFESSDPAVATVTGNTVTIRGTGTATITASQPGNDIFEQAAPVQQTLTVQLVTDLGEAPGDAVVKVYPNPVHEALNIGVASTGAVWVEMFDAMGRVVTRETASSGEDMTLKVDHLQPGVYHLKVSTGRQVVTRQIIKK